jgi:zinc protease
MRSASRMRPLRVWLCAALLGASSVHAEPPSAPLATPAPSSEPTLPFERIQLKNGLTVLLSEDHRLPQVAVNVWYHVGAANQGPGQSGFAHLFEHMMFSGAKHLPKPPLQMLEAVGVPTSAANGTTDFDRTNYFEVVPTQQLPLALWIESERMGFLLDTLDEHKLQIQRDVVSNERRQRYENRPYGQASIRLCNLLFPNDHPYHACVIGEIGEIQAAKLESVRDFFRAYYRPSNASLAIVGDFDPKVAKELVTRYFETLPSGAPIPAPKVTVAPINGVVSETLTDTHAVVPQAIIAWHGTRPYAEDDMAGDVLSLVLGSGRTSRLYKTLVLEQQIAADVSANNPSLRLGGYFAVGATAVMGHTWQELREECLRQVREVREHGITAQELARARRQLLAMKLKQMERIGGFGGKADLLNELEMYVGDPGFLPQYLERVRKVTAEDVQKFAQKYLVEDHRVELSVVPAGGGK